MLFFVAYNDLFQDGKKDRIKCFVNADSVASIVVDEHVNSLDPDKNKSVFTMSANMRDGSGVELAIGPWSSREEAEGAFIDLMESCDATII